MTAAVSVVTVVRNNLAGLRVTAASLRAQTCRDFEWIVVDGDSTDGTKDWLLRHEREITWWRSAPDRGLYHAMNIGWSQARGHAAIFLNGGDGFADADTVKRLVAALDTNPGADFLYGDSLECLTDGRVGLKRARSHRLWPLGMFTHHQAMLFGIYPERSINFEETYPIGADYAVTSQTVRHARKVVRLNFPVCLVAIPGVSAANTTQGRRDQFEIRRKILKINAPVCLILEGIQWTAQAIRDHFPGIYLSIRFRFWALSVNIPE